MDEANNISTAGSPGNPSGIAFGSTGHVTVEIDGRPSCSSDGRCLPSKRKANDDDVSGQLSHGYPREQPAEDMVPARSVACSTNVSFMTENTVVLNQQFDLNFQYEVRERVGPSTILPVVGAGSFPVDTLRSSSLRIDHGRQQYPDQLRVNGIGRNGSSAITDYLTRVQQQSQIAPHAFHIPGVQRTVGPLFSDPSSSIRFGSLPSVMVGERPSVLPVNFYSTNMPRAPEDRPFQIPIVHTTAVVQQPTNLVLTNANISLPGRHNSISQVGSSSRPGFPRRAPDYLTTIQHSRRLAGNTRRLAGIRRTLLLATNSDSDSEDETIGHVLSSTISQQGNPQPFQGPVFRSDTQDDDVQTLRLSRALHASRENRRRLLSEIQRVMALFRSGGLPDLQDLAVPRSLIVGLLQIQDGHRDMRLDVDNMSYEELLALEEHIGNVTTGLSEETIMKYLHRVRYLSPRSEHSEVEPCCICQEEIILQEEIGMLDCGHDFHTGCIKRWLMEKNVCPICKTTALVELPDV